MLEEMLSVNLCNRAKLVQTIKILDIICSNFNLNLPIWHLLLSITLLNEGKKFSACLPLSFISPIWYQQFFGLFSLYFLTTFFLDGFAATLNGYLFCIQDSFYRVICFQQWISCSATKIASTMWHFFPL